MGANDRAYLDERRAALLRELARKIRDPRVLAAFEAVPRHCFVPEVARVRAYEDRALPLFEEQTISQPSMVAIMLDALALEPGHRVLEVGAGSGYCAALLSHLAADVHTMEIRHQLFDWARAALDAAGVRNVTLHLGDGTQGLPALAPFDRILVSAGGTRAPEPLVAQLGAEGRIAIPIGDRDAQRLRIGRKGATGHGVEWRNDVQCVFVPLVER